MKRLRGFTLVELLVALFVTAILFAMSYGAINQAIKNRDGLEANQLRLVAVQRTIRSFVQDFSQAAPRPVRDQVGSSYEAAFRSGAGTGVLVTLTRGGWANPAGVQRGTLQRVNYVFADGRLRREAFPVLDRTGDVQPRGRELLTGVKSVKLRYMNDGYNWGEVWPPASAVAQPEVERRWRPLAVEVTLELEDWGRIVRIIEVAR